MGGGGHALTELGFRFGTMTADLTRDTFNPVKHFCRVLMQQGRVQLDADWNEQAAILLHFVQSLAADLIGPHGGPANSFEVTALEPKAGVLNFNLAAGNYYVNGVLCENEAVSEYAGQPGLPGTRSDAIAKMVQAIVYLDVWERHVTAVEDGSIREVALDGPDTTTRSQVLWQAKLLGVDTGSEIAKQVQALQAARAGLADMETKGSIPGIRQQRAAIATAEDNILTALIDQFGRNQFSLPGLQARARQPGVATTEPCTIPPDAKYRGPENQLYRVQIHAGGQASGLPVGVATFKWSRENGSVIFPIVGVEGKVLALQHLGRDRRGGLRPGDWIEVEDDDYVLQGAAAPLRQVQAVDDDRMTVTLDQPPAVAISMAKHPIVRRWDHGRADATSPGDEVIADGAIRVVEGSGEGGWIDLEDGVQVQFQLHTDASVSVYKTGDYWLVPARTATADVEWPQTIGPPPGPATQPPRGIHHHYAPLAHLTLNNATIAQTVSLRRIIPSLDAIFS